MKADVCDWCSYLERMSWAMEREYAVVQGSCGDENAIHESKTCGSRFSGGPS